jgi:hypothetical protein
MANVYNRGKKVLVDGTVDWDGVTAVKVMLVTSAYTYSPDHNVRSDVSGEITNGGYSRQALSGRTITEDDTNDWVVLDATDTTFAALAAGDQPAAAIVFRDSGAAGTDDLIAYNVLTSPPAPNGGDYKIVWDANGVVTLKNS